MIILFDIGGTKMRLAGTSDCREFSEPIILDTPDHFDNGVELFLETAKKIAGDEKIDFACGGLAGTLNKEKSGIVKNASSNLPDWEEKSLKDALESGLNTNICIENDADIVGLGESVHGAGRGASIVGYVTVSTGVGGGRIVNGQIDRNTIGFEPGHQFIDGTKTLEHTVSGTAVEKRFNKKPYDIPQSDGLWVELAGHLARGLHNTTVHWSTDVLVLGGSMIVGDPAILIPDIEKSLKEVTCIKRELPVIKKAELGAVGGLFGALAYAAKMVN